MSSSNRKVYQMGDMSIREFYSAPTRYLAESISKESEFEKPYLDDDRGKMHMDFPWPDWPSMPDIPPWPPWKIPDFPPLSKWCMLWSPFSSYYCEDGWVNFGVAVCCVPEAGQFCDFKNPARWKLWGDYIEGSQREGFLGIEVDIDKEAALQRPDKRALIKACFTDCCGNVCCAEEEVTCKVCPPDVSVNWVSDVNLTIGQGNGGYALAGVEIADGLGPYKWEVSGTGFSLLYEETAGLSNTLQADATACGMATIKVTDDCEEDCTGQVRCTADSSWVETGGATGAYDGGITWCYGAAFGFLQTELIVGDERWFFTTSTTNCMTAAPNDSWVNSSGVFVIPPCGGPFDCAPTQGQACNGTNPPACSGYLQIFSAKSYEWRCN